MLDESRKKPTLQDLYPDLSEEQLAMLDEDLTRYVESTVRLYEAICADPERYAIFKALTAEGRARTMDHPERSNSDYPK